ncbi:PD40 domain-containing protein [Chryseolinea lacunae]|uniref:PD40 domain-containing protein n=1 Tax=Chryseolinea lacunae TaxID=2801331 RepID=A0ABS1KZF7_9BACT|nr:PD40 domain-containing protein [Chryseolinea lacunae]MBL0744769.1 PD40 domain-containing protein [Chryseolinea lacunae]
MPRFSFVLLFVLGMMPAMMAQPKPYAHNGALPQPRIFAEGIVSTGDYESHAEFSPTGDTLYFVKSGPDVSKWTICVSYFKKNAWTKPVVAPFSGQYMDADPFFTKDGKTLYFISNRPLKEGDPAKADMDIWKMQRTSAGWGKPTRLDDTINSDKSEYYPTLTSTGTLYFGSRREGGRGGSDLYRSVLVDGKYQTPENLGDAINTDGSEYEPFVFPDERVLIFLAARPDHLDNADFFISYNQDGKWSPAEKLPEPFNSPVTEFSPKVTRDGKYFFFASSRNRNPAASPRPETEADMDKRLHSAGNGLCDVYQVDISALLTRKTENTEH